MHALNVASLCAVVAGLTAMGCGSGDSSPSGSSTSHASSSSSGSGGSGGMGGAGGSASNLVWAKCDTSQWPDGFPFPPSSVQCTSIDVPLDHTAPNGPTVALRVGRQLGKATGNHRALFELSGGPGGSSVVDSTYLGGVFPKVLDDHDLIFVDLRGTGGSHYLDCPNGYPSTTADWQACGAALESEPLDHDLSVDAAFDIDFVRALLGYDKIAIYGSSYGTRTGLEYIRQHGDRLESAVLDGVVPPDIDLIKGDNRAFSTGVSLLESDCAADAACMTISPTLDADLTSLYQARTASPEPVIINGNHDVENGDNFKFLLQSFLLDVSFRYQVPRAIHQAALGDRTLWYNMAGMLLGKTFVDNPGGNLVILPPWSAPKPFFTHGISPVSPGIFETVDCAEAYPVSGGLAALSADEAAQPWVSTQSELVFIAACDSWPVKPIDPSLHAAVSSDVPVLLMSGAIDLETFPSYGDHAKATLSHGSHVIVPYANHGTIQVPCAQTIMQAFIEANGDLSQVDQSCIGALHHPAW